MRTLAQEPGLSGRTRLAPGVGGHPIAKRPEVLVRLCVELGEHGLAGRRAGGVDQPDIERRQVGQDTFARLAACSLGAGAQAVERPHDFVEHVVGQPQCRRRRP